MPLLFSLVLLIAIIAALADIITAGPERIRNLDKTFWIIIVILIPFVGTILWFTVGREYPRPVERQAPAAWRPREQPRPAPLDTEQELAALEREIAEDRIRQLEAELRARRAKGSEG